jgi:zinc protease
MPAKQKFIQSFATVALSTVMLLTLLCGPLHADTLDAHVLPNGLEIFLVQNSQVPLVTIMITFRAGAIVETEQINGLCHLYEHMLFKGNEHFTSQEDFMAAMKRMGVANWNGGTSTEYVTYFFTIPSNHLAEGLEFWAAAVQSPLLRKDELEIERQVVYNEIAGRQAQPEHRLEQARRHALYPDYWFRRDVGGDLQVIRSATVEQLRFIQQNFYVPNNAALFVAGDIKPQETLSLVRKFFGTWKTGTGFPTLEPHKPLPEPQWVVVDNSPTQGQAHVQMVFRGPDTAVDSASTYTADIWTQMINSPQGRFKTSLERAVPELYGGTRHISAGYYTQRDGGQTSFSFTITVPEKEKLWDIIIRLRLAVLHEINAMRSESYFEPAEFDSARREIENQEIIARDIPERYIRNLSFWWASTSTDYYVGYVNAIRAVTPQNVCAYVERYLYDAPFLTSIWLHADDEARQHIKPRAAKHQR